jgi:hypothetical protein
MPQDEWVLEEVDGEEDGPSTVQMQHEQTAEEAVVAAVDMHGHGEAAASMWFDGEPSTITYDEAIVSQLSGRTVEDIFAETDVLRNDDNEIHVVLDCANIGYDYGQDDFSAQGVYAALQYFKNARFLQLRVTAFLPAYMVRRKPTDGARGNAIMQTEDIELLQRLVEARELTLVPPADYDDFYIIAFAYKHNGFIISNDRFKDHIESIQDPAIQARCAQWMALRRVSYTFVNVSGHPHFEINPASKLAELLRADAPTPMDAPQLPQQGYHEPPELLLQALEHYNAGDAHACIYLINDWLALTAAQPSPFTADAFNLRGKAYATLGQHVLAASDLERALHLRPDDEGFQYDLQHLLHSMK